MRLILVPGLFMMSLFFSAAAQVETVSVNPAQTSTQIKAIQGDHVAYIDTTAKPLHKLLLMIVGTGAAANHNIPFFNFAASAGYHVISLDYKNTVITTVCSNSEDSGCFNKFRQEIVFGEPVSPLVEVDSANSIYNRFYTLLAYLAKKYPRQGWGQYLKGDAVQWQKITVAGHSQGAGHAAWLGKKFSVDRVLIFAGPQDYLVRFNAPAGWLSQKGVTAPSKYFAFLHVRDPYDFNKQLADCLKLMPAINADTLLVQPGAGITKSKHILVTNIETGNPHESMMQPAFKPAWAWLLSADPGK
jgi:pimeloyl-ACP methyl ester carboxylesterase